MSFNLRLRIAIDSCNYSVAEVAEKLGIKPQAVYKWLKQDNAEKITMENAIKLANELGVDPAWLLFGAENQTPEPIDLEQLKITISELEPKYQQVINELVKGLKGR